MSPEEKIAKWMGWTADHKWGRYFESCPVTGGDVIGMTLKEWNPAENPAHATMVWDHLRNSGVSVEFESGPDTDYPESNDLICTLRWDFDKYGNFKSYTVRDGDTWMQALVNAVLQYLDSKEE